MYWQEEHKQEKFQVPDRVVDLQFAIDCPTLPMDHAWVLSQQIQQWLPWFADEPQAGLHIIHGADSGNGWERPQGSDDLLYLPRRTKLVLRLPKQRLGDAETLCGQTLQVAGHRMTVGSCKSRPLRTTDILYSRYVAVDPSWNEQQFMRRAADQLAALGVQFKKMLCGKSCQLNTPDGPTATRSLMLADLSYQDAITLQEQGIGPLRNMGCGLFLQQKGF